MGAVGNHVLTIVDDEATPLVAFTAAEHFVSEAAGGYDLEVVLTGASSQDVVVPFTVSGSAEPGVDFSLGSSPLVVPAGEVQATLQVVVLDDSLDEADEDLVVQLGTPIGAELGAIANTTLFMGDDDGSPQVQWAQASLATLESAPAIDVQLTLTAVSGLDVEVAIGLAGTASPGVDFVPLATNLTIPAGASFLGVSLTLNDDLLDEEDESIELLLDAPVNANLGALVPPRDHAGGR